MNMEKFSGFYKKSIKERIELLKSECSLSEEELSTLTGPLSHEIADRMVENVVGAIHIPLGLATNFRINGKEILIPMAIEEPSVIAAACNGAKLTLPQGFTADADEPIMIGQIQFVGVDIPAAIKKINKNKSTLLSTAKEFAVGIEKYGGGVRDLRTKKIKTPRGEMLIVEFDIDVRDAMGANTINTVLEKSAPHIKELIGGEYRLRILTNLAVKRKVRANAVWKKEALGGEETIDRILDGYAFAVGDIFRCTTHNKGIMNGIDAVALACGQDWRAIEAGAHAYAAIEGYKPLTQYEKTKEGDLLGKIELPIAAGTVGGAINTLPSPKIMFKIMNIKSSKELAMCMACVGLSNSFAALRALSTEGIQSGHMGLHARNLAVIAGAKNPQEIEKLTELMKKENNFSVDFAKEKLKGLRT